MPIASLNENLVRLPQDACNNFAPRSSLNPLTRVRDKMTALSSGISQWNLAGRIFRPYSSQANPHGQQIRIVFCGAATNRTSQEYATGNPVRVSIRNWGLARDSTWTQNQAYTAFYQISDHWMPMMHGDVTVTVRKPIAPATVMTSIKAAVYGAGSDQPVYKVQTMQEIVSESMSPQRLPMILLGVFSGLALLLASVGIYGVISYSV